MQLSVVTRFQYPLPDLEARIRAARGDQKSTDSWLNACRTVAREIQHNVRFELDLAPGMDDNQITAIFM